MNDKNEPRQASFLLSADPRELGKSNGFDSVLTQSVKEQEIGSDTSLAGNYRKFHDAWWLGATDRWRERMSIPRQRWR